MANHVYSTFYQALYPYHFALSAPTVLPSCMLYNSPCATFAVLLSPDVHFIRDYVFLFNCPTKGLYIIPVFCNTAFYLASFSC